MHQMHAFRSIIWIYPVLIHAGFRVQIEERYGSGHVIQVINAARVVSAVFIGRRGIFRGRIQFHFDATREYLRFAETKREALVLRCQRARHKLSIA